MADFRIHDIPDDVWKRFKALCALEEKTMNEKFIEMIREAVEKAGLNKL